MKSKQMIELANALIHEIKTKSDCFETTTIVFPNVLVEQWFKAYWLKTEGDNVLMNVEFKNINEILYDLVEQSNYKLIKYSKLKQIILSIMMNDTDNIIPKEYKDYYKDIPVKISDFASQLTTLFLDYYSDNYEGIDNFTDNWQYNLYQKIVEVSKNYNFGTIEKVKPNNSNKKLYLFGFNKLDKVYRYLLDNSNSITEYSLDVDDSHNADYSISYAPSKLKEIESIHSDICKHLMDGSVVSDFLVVAPNISDYANDIERVFRQNDKEYPFIPYVIRKTGKTKTDVTLLIELFYKIYKNKFYTRLDFYKIVSNPIVQQVRNISNEEIDNWMRTITNLNLYRNHPFLDDWIYLKKRLLLSKVSSINFEDNIVSLKDKDYIPYTNIEFDDESIVKLVKVIDDLYSFINLFDDKTIIDNNLIDHVKEELDKWLSLPMGDVETNTKYKKVLSSIESLKEIDINNLPIDTFFYMLIDDSTVSNIQYGQAFINGITFTNFDINSVVTAKYVYFIGASSSNIPVTKIKSELDLRKELEKNDDEQTFKLLYQNTENLYISYVAIDLKTDEEFYITPIVKEFDKKKGKYTDADYNPIPLDETRSYNVLFTRKEFNDKAYFKQLLNKNKEKKKIEELSKPRFYESVSVRQMAKYIEEPLCAKANVLFNNDDDLQEKIKDEWEPFKPNALTKSIVEKKIIYSLINKSFNEDETRKELILSNTISTISSRYRDSIFDDCLTRSNLTIGIINNFTNGKYQILEPATIKLNSNDGREWMLSASNPCAIFVDDYDRYYFEFKDMTKPFSISKFLELYIIALMDVAKLDDNLYHIILVKGPSDKKPPKKFAKRRTVTFNVRPKRAKEILNSIHDVMGDYTHNVLVPLSLAEKKIEKFDELEDAVRWGEWNYFAFSSLFKPEEDYGYNRFKFNEKIFIDELNRQIDLVEYLEPKTEEDDKNGTE